MQEKGVYNMVFSSSATVYGQPQYLPLDEKHPVGGCTNPYGRTKYFIEEILKDICTADKVSCSYHSPEKKVGNFYLSDSEFFWQKSFFFCQ